MISIGVGHQYRDAGVDSNVGCGDEILVTVSCGEHVGMGDFNHCVACIRKFWANCWGNHRYMTHSAILQLLNIA